MCCRSKRLPSRLSLEDARALLIVAYFRALWRATSCGGQNIGVVPLGGGVFANKPEDVRESFVLAYQAYVATGGTARVSMVLWSPEGSPPDGKPEWDAAIDAGLGWGVPDGLDALEAELTAAFVKDGCLLLARVPSARTSDELTSLLKEKASSDLLAAEFLWLREDGAKRKALDAELASGQRWCVLIASLLAQVGIL